eukprot:13960820-Alexandrium_andersonii.AAC.1
MAALAAKHERSKPDFPMYEGSPPSMRSPEGPRVLPPPPPPQKRRSPSRSASPRVAKPGGGTTPTATPNARADAPRG